jgi:hypothetical protein
MDRIQLVQAHDNLPFGATPDHIFGENTVKQVAIRRINGTFQGCDHSQYCIPVPGCGRFEERWRLRQ